tara:strand:- start:1801 stop:2673 length:873 start_codon:yes stop_codon:yes gene_type:complete
VILTDTKECREAYREILQGYSYLPEEKLYLKHFSESDLGELEFLYKECTRSIEAQGIEKEKDKLKFLEKEGHWTEGDEASYVEAKLAVQDAYEFKRKLVDQEQAKNFEQVIEEQEKNFKEISDSRHSILYPTLEGYCDKKINEHYVRLSLFKDKELKEPLLTEEEFEDLSFIELNKFIVIYNNISLKFDQKNIDRIAVNSFFLNAFMMSNNDPVKFYGKSVLELTLYQMNVFNKGKYYKSILEEGKDPPNTLYETIDQHGLDPIVNWYNTAFNQIRNERERQAMQARSRR